MNGHEYLRLENELTSISGVVFKDCSISDFISALCERNYSFVETHASNAHKAFQKASFNLFRQVLSRLLIADSGQIERNPRQYRVQDRLIYCLHSSIPYSCNGYATRGHGIAKTLLSQYSKIICASRPGFPWDTVPDLKGNPAPFLEIVDGVSYLKSPIPNRESSANYALDSYDYFARLLSIYKPAFMITASSYSHSLPALLAAQARETPSTYEVRGFWEITRVSREPSFAATTNHITSILLESICCALADRVATLTTPMKMLLEARGINSEKICLVPNSIPQSLLSSKLTYDNQLAISLGIKRSDTVIGYIGSFVQYEGLELLCEAICELTKNGYSFKLLAVGSENASSLGEEGDGPITKEIKKIKSKYEEHGDCIILTGRVPHSKVYSYYSIVDIAAFPRYTQPVTDFVSPIKPIEAAAVGKAILMSDVGGMLEILDETSCIRFKANDKDDLIRRLIQLYKNKDLASSLGDNAKAWVRENRLWESTAINLIPTKNQYATNHS